MTARATRDELESLARRIASGDLAAARRAVAVIEARRGIGPRGATAGNTLHASDFVEGWGPEHIAFGVAMKHGKSQRHIRVVVHVKHVLGLADAIRICPTRWPGGHGVWHYQRGHRSACPRGQFDGKEAGGLKDGELEALGLEIPEDGWRA